MFWHGGGAWNDADLVDVERNASATPVKPKEFMAPAGLQSQTLRGAIKGHAVLVTNVVCGAREIELWTLSMRGAPDAVHRTELASLRCTPDAARDKEIAASRPDRAQLDDAIGRRAPARFDVADRSGWKRIDEGEPEVVQLEGPASSILMGFGFAHEPTDAALEQLMTSMHAKLGSGTPRRLSFPPEVHFRGAVGSLHCPDGWVALIYMEPGDGEVAKAEAITGAHCLAAGAPDVAWPR